MKHRWTLSIVIVAALAFGAGPVKKAKEAEKPAEPVWTVRTLAGAGERGFADGKAAEAKFDAPWGVAVDKDLNVWVSEFGGNRIRLVRKDGTVVTIAGSGEKGPADGTGAKAQFNAPAGIALDPAGNLVVADSGNGAVRRVTPGGKVTTLATKFKTPMGVAVNAAGETFVADIGLSRIRRILPDGTIEPFSGSGTMGNEDGSDESCKFYHPTGLALVGKSVYVTDAGANVVRRLTSTGISSLYAGSGSEGYRDAASTSAQFNGPAGIVAAPSGELFVVDAKNNHVRRIGGEETVVSSIAGWPAAGYADGAGLKAAFRDPHGIAVSAEGDLVVADSGNHAIRIVLPPDRDAAGLPVFEVARKKTWLDDAEAIKRGKADTAKIVEVIKGSADELSTCYARATEGDKPLKGSLTVYLLLGEDGALKDYDLKDHAIGSRNLEACILGLAPKWKFPAPSKGGTAVVTHAFTFGK